MRGSVLSRDFWAWEQEDFVMPFRMVSDSMGFLPASASLKLCNCAPYLAVAYTVL